MLLRYFIRIGVLNSVGSYVEQIRFIAAKHFDQIFLFLSMLVDREEPLLCVLKAVVICDVEGDDDSIGLLVKLVGQVSKLLLASRVP